MRITLLLISVFISQAVFAGLGSADFLDKDGNFTVKDNLNNGYITVTVPLYEAAGKDEGVLPGSYIALKIDGREYKCLEFYSMPSDDNWQSEGDSYWSDAKRYTSGAQRVEALAKDGSGILSTSATRFIFGATDGNGQCFATFIIYINEDLLSDNSNKEVSCIFNMTIDVNQDDDGGLNFTKEKHVGTLPIFSIPTINEPIFSSTAGNYSVNFNTSGAKDGSYYKWDGGKNTVGNSGTVDFEVSDEEQTKKLYFYYRVSAYQEVLRTNSVTLPPYQQARDISLTNITNGNTEIKWTVSTSSSSTFQDKFEVIRSTDQGFSSYKTVGSVNYDSNQQEYSLVDETGLDNINGKVYYRIRRTAATSWDWNFYQEANIVKTVSHILIKKGSVKESIDDNNKATVTWEYDDATTNVNKVLTENTKIIIKRKRLDTQQETKTEFDFDVNKTSYSEDLTVMCEEYHYSVYIVPGSDSYKEQEPVEAVLADESKPIVPTDLGNISFLIASKGYFSDRVELEWNLEDGAAETFSVQRRLYGSNDDFKQLDTKPAFESSKKYTYTDKTCVPGEIYEYRLAAMTSCVIDLDPVYSPLAIGFRTPTGDLYGRVTFENGQAEEGVEINVTTLDEIQAQSLEFSTSSTAKVYNTDLLKENTDAVTIQAYVSPDKKNGRIISKEGMYELGFKNDKYYFKAGDKTVDVSVDSLKASKLKEKAAWVHISGVYTGEELIIYIDGDSIASELGSPTILGNDNNVVFGGSDFEGKIDEVRIWNRVLDKEEIKQDYNRYLIGSEIGLLAYYRFNYAIESDFFDVSYAGTVYNENHGELNNLVISSDVPTVSQLGYKGVTRYDGSYEVRAIPYKGNGTAYYISPKLGIHTFESAQEVRFINEQAQSHTVNFIDKSSFEVEGFITYSSSNIPVEGVEFKVDGISVLQSNGMPCLSKADGSFKINVPVGVHEVKAVKAGHEFEDDGKITDPNGMNLNYQDAISGIELKDKTTIKYIGRVAGGVIQEEYPLGHSLSKNNLAAGIKVTLTHTKTETYVFNDTSIVEQHFIPSNKITSHSNNVDYKDNQVIIYVNDTTGEFVANIIPEKFTVKVDAGTNHTDIPNSGSTIDLTQKYIELNEVYEYTDSVEIDDEMQYFLYSDTVFYEFSQKFIKRYEPEIRVSQVDVNNNILPYFGSDTVVIPKMIGEPFKVPLYSSETKDYTFQKPLYEMNKTYNMKMEVFEKYNYYNGSDIVSVDEVPTSDAIYQIDNQMASGEAKSASIESDSVGVGYYSFVVAEPEMTTAIRTINLKVAYGETGSQTSIDWVHPSFLANGEVYTIGSHQTGTDFVTAGPDKVLTVLRDPPGSNSYAYLEKGTSFTESSAYNGSISNSGEHDFTVGLKKEIITFAGVGAGVIDKTAETESGTTIGVLHEESYSGQDSKTTTTTTTTSFQTSSDPAYVGTDADLYIGYSTNITFGSTDNVTIVSTEDFAKYTEGTYVEVGDWAIVKSVGSSMSQSFSTLFAYPQIHIEEVLIPKFEEIIQGVLLEGVGLTDAELQAVANSEGRAFYRSYFDLEHEDFGKCNEDTTIADKSNGVADDSFNGPSYRIFMPEDPNFTASDTIAYLNQSIEAWVAQMGKNEKAKVEAELLENYSFQAGAEVGYSESYSTEVNHESSFYVNIGGKVANETYLGATGVKAKYVFNEEINTSHGGTFTSAAEANHSKGFVLSESGSDYLSVDVYREKGWDVDDEKYDSDGNGGSVAGSDVVTKDYYSSFIFKTKAGATSCPYEGAYVTKYFEPGQHVINEATKKVEVPEVEIEDKFIENVPSGEPAYITLYLRNNSETGDDNWYDLDIIDESNPNGARFSIDGASLGSSGLAYVVPAGETLTKTLEVRKGSVLNYDDLKLVLKSQCQSDPTDFQEDIADTVAFTVHFIPSCTSLNLAKPANNWVYNTKLPEIKIEGVDKHYMPVEIDGFNVNYDNFGWIKLQYKSAAQSDEDWTTLMSYYNDSTLYKTAIDNGISAEMIDAKDAGTIKYNFMMDDMSDQKYDLRAVSICVINNIEVENVSEISSGIKDMYRPRLFGTAQPADGVLDVEDEVMLTFNEQIAEGLLIYDNFQVRGVRNGTISDYSTSVRFDGIDDYMNTEFAKNLEAKPITVEMWIQADKLQDATLFSHGNINESLELSLTADECLKVKIGNTVLTSKKLGQTSANPNYADGSWAHVALVYDYEDGYVSAYYNFNEVISNAVVLSNYDGIGNFVLGKSISSDAANYAGKMHNVRVWEKTISERNLQVNSNLQLAGIEEGLLAYYPMNEGRGVQCDDKARGATMTMYGSSWTLPEGFAAEFNGANYLKVDASTSAITPEMDFTIEFWFKAAEGQTNATIMSAGTGLDGSVAPENGFAVGFDANGGLTFSHNSKKVVIEGSYGDNDWHHFAISANRTIGRAQIYLDGKLSTFISTEDVYGIASDYIFVGARAWYAEDDALNLIVDNHFKGLVDDIRFWELYKNEEMINENNNVKLTGEELGLIHYYPFDYYIEHQGVKYVEFTNEDQRISQTINPETDKFEVIGSAAVESKDIAPLKDAGPIEDLKFDFVVNDDALIINLLEEEYKIAKTIVTFTVSDVRDVNGNSIASPITWTAYIDQNQLRWETDRMDIEKANDEEYVFALKAINSGGSVERYSINNIPYWLEVNRASGNIDPVSYEEIEFTISESVNVGTYNEVIYLTNEDNVSEALNLTLVVKGEEPDWFVNPADFKYNMSLYGKMRFDNIFSTDKGDKLAVFEKGKCIGATTSTYNKEFDIWYALMTIYSNNKQIDNLEFRMWDASTGITYKAQADQRVVFLNDAIIGSPSLPVIFDGAQMICQNIELNKGWTWISFNLADENLSDVNTTLTNGLWNSDCIVKSFNNFDSYSDNTKEWKGTLSKDGGFNNTSMYMINSSEPQILSVSGSKLDIANTKIPIEAGRWNFISYLPLEKLSIDRAMAGYTPADGDVLKSQDGFAMAYKNRWIGNLTYMEPNKGYMLLNTKLENDTLVYPAVNSMQLRSAFIDKPELDMSSYSGNMSVVAKVTGNVSDSIYAIVNGEVRGLENRISVDGEELVFIPVSGNDYDGELTFASMRNGEIQNISNTTMKYKKDAVYGSIENPMNILFDDGSLINVSPSPFQDYLNIKLQLEKNSKIYFEIVDVAGRVVLKTAEEQAEVGAYTKTINTSSFTKGVYMVKICLDDMFITKKVTNK